MWKIWQQNGLILGLLSLSLFSSCDCFFGIYDNSDKRLNDVCILDDNSKGICKQINNCEIVKNLIKIDKTKIVHCLFTQSLPIVCCAETQKITAPSALTVKKSKKFQAALCKSQSQSPLRLDQHIVGNAKQAEVGEFPYQVALGYDSLDQNSPKKFLCGGSLIADDIILTAAHCVTDRRHSLKLIRLGRTSLDPNDEDDDGEIVDIDVKDVKVHKDYKRSTSHHDIALLKLMKPVTFSSVINPICLSTRSYIKTKNFTVTGFGVMDFNTKKKSDWLLKGTVFEYSLDKCRESFKEAKLNKVIIDSQICTSNDDGIDTCQGDSGGPMVYEEDNVKYLFGITSYGIGCGSSFPSIYTRVDKYLDWIETNMALVE